MPNRSPGANKPQDFNLAFWGFWRILGGSGSHSGGPGGPKGVQKGSNWVKMGQIGVQRGPGVLGVRAQNELRGQKGPKGGPRGGQKGVPEGGLYI